MTIAILLLLSVSIIYWTQKLYYIRNKNQIQSIERINNSIYIEFILPQYMRYEGYWRWYYDDSIFKIDAFSKFNLSMKNTKVLTIDLNNAVPQEEKEKIKTI